MAKILIVDDREINRRFLTTLLGYKGHHLLEARDGAEGLRVALAEVPDLIITDVLMPTMDGYQFVRLLREQGELDHVPVIFSTAHFLSRESQALADSCGVTSIIYKPCEPQDVLDIVERALNTEPVGAPRVMPVEEFNREHLELLTNKLAEKNEDLRVANQKLTALFDLSHELDHERDPLFLLDQYCDVAREVVGAGWALVVVINAHKPGHVYTVGLETISAGNVDALMTYLTHISRSNESHGAIRLNDNSGLKTFQGLRLTSLLAVPLNIAKGLGGWLCLMDKLGGLGFGDEDERLAATFAAQIVVAYKNALLLDVAQSNALTLQNEIADRRRVEDNLRQSEAQFSSLIASAMDAIIAVDSSQRVCLFNAAAEKMFQVTKEKAMGQPLDNFIPAHMREMHRDHIRAFGKTHATSRAMGALGAVSGIDSNGRQFPIEASISQVEINGEKLYTAILRDITDRQEAEQALLAKNEALAATTQQLWQASKLATMGELAASIAHELNNPLATLALRTEFLKSQIPEDDEKQNAVDIIAQEIDRMASLVGNLLQFSRRSHAQVSTLDVREELDSSLDLIHYHLRSHSIKVVKEFAADLPPVLADRQQLRQVFLNLKTNATDAMPEGGTLTLRAFRKSVGQDPFVVVEFADTGSGIESENLTKVFEPFFTTKPEGKGTGLGLAICRRTIEEHRGTIDIESERGKGTTIRINLPLNNQPAVSI